MLHTTFTEGKKKVKVMALFGKSSDVRTYLTELMSEREKLTGHAARLVDQGQCFVYYLFFAFGVALYGLAFHAIGGYIKV